jgi:hypothetical protein
MGWNAGHNDWSNNYHGHCGSHRSSEFCSGYYNGVNGNAYFSQGNTQQTQSGTYSGNSPTTTTNQQPAFIGKDFGDFTDIPIVGGTIGNHQTGVLHNEQGVFIPWSKICDSGQTVLQQQCSSLVNPNGSLTSQGDTAVECIRNGLAAAIVAQQNGVGQGLTKGALSFLAPLTGCGGIVDINQVASNPMFQQILQILTQNVK